VGSNPTASAIGLNSWTSMFSPPFTAASSDAGRTRNEAKDAYDPQHYHQQHCCAALRA
jgi:hypothetical protein